MLSSIAPNPRAGLSMLRISKGTGLLETEMLLSGEYQVGSFFGHHDRRAVGITRGDRRKYRGIDDA
jgi:hypothetical protein